MRLNTINHQNNPPALKSSEASITKHQPAAGENATTKTRWADAGFTFEQLKDHEDVAWRALIPVLGRIAESYLGKSFTNPGDLQPLTFGDAEEITTEICEDLYRRVKNFKSLDHLEASFRKALNHKAIDRKRAASAQSRGGGRTVSIENHELKPGENKDPVEVALTKKIEPFTNQGIENDESTILEGPADVGDEDILLRQVLFECAEELDGPDQELVQLLYENRSQEEIAQALGVNVKNVSQMQSRVYDKLKRKLRARLGQKALEDYDIEEN